MGLKKCPVCKVELLLAERQGVEIDYCKKCGGVWLDKDELESIVNISDQWTGKDSLGAQKNNSSFFGELLNFDESDEEQEED